MFILNNEGLHTKIMSLPQRRKRMGGGGGRARGAFAWIPSFGFNTRVYSCMARKKWQERNTNRIFSMHKFALQQKTNYYKQ